MTLMDRRYRKEKWFRLCCICVASLAIGMLLCLLSSILKTGFTACLRTEICLECPAVSSLSADLSLRKIVRDSFPQFQKDQDIKMITHLMSWGAHRLIKQAIRRGKSSVWVPMGDEADGFYKAFCGLKSYDQKRLYPVQHRALDILCNIGALHLRWNTDFFTAADSQEPELAGIAGAGWGSFYTLLIAFLVSFPLGVGAGVFLEEFAPRNRLTYWVELHIQNLTAVPSIIFGLLGMAVWDRCLGLPRPSALLGGLTLALMLCPAFVVTTRLALRRIPRTLREAAYALGASRVQVVMHHCFPYAFLTIITGTMLNMARALGESAPLLIVGMVVFIGDVPETITDPATVLPIQIFSWARGSEVGFLEKTSGAILGLLFFLVLMNGLVAFLKRRWSLVR